MTDTPMLCWCGGKTYTEMIGGVDPWVRCEDSDQHDPLATGAPDTIRTLYVSGPMSGIPECNYPHFNEVADALRAHGYTVVNPVDVEVAGGAAHYVDHLRKDIRALLDCDGVAVLEGWWASTGARTEVTVAGVLKMPVRPWQEWLQ